MQNFSPPWSLLRPWSAKIQNIRKKFELWTSTFEYPNCAWPYPRPMVHPCKISVPRDRYYSRDLQKFEKFEKIRTSTFEYPNSGGPSPAHKDYSNKFLASWDKNCDRDAHYDIVSDTAPGTKLQLYIKILYIKICRIRGYMERLFKKGFGNKFCHLNTRTTTFILDSRVHNCWHGQSTN